MSAQVENKKRVYYNMRLNELPYPIAGQIGNYETASLLAMTSPSMRTATQARLTDEKELAAHINGLSHNIDVMKKKLQGLRVKARPNDEIRLYYYWPRATGKRRLKDRADIPTLPGIRKGNYVMFSGGYWPDSSVISYDADRPDFGAPLFVPVALKRFANQAKKHGEYHTFTTEELDNIQRDRDRVIDDGESESESDDSE